MKHLRQPADSKLCGQTCVAIVTGKSIQDVIDVIGRSGTHYTTLRKAIAAISKGSLGPVIQRRTQITDVPMRGTYIVRIIWSSKPHRSHFVVLHNGIVYDPGWEATVPFINWLDTERMYHHNRYLQITSWAEWRPK